jgi:hypothetical protein
MKKKLDNGREHLTFEYKSLQIGINPEEMYHEMKKQKESCNVRIRNFRLSCLAPLKSPNGGH